jgi:hypothetical protein
MIHLVKKFPAFFGTQKFVIVFTIARHWYLSWDRCIQFTLFHSISLRYILLLSSRLRLGLPRDVFQRQNFHKSIVQWYINNSQNNRNTFPWKQLNWVVRYFVLRTTGATVVRWRWHNFPESSESVIDVLSTGYKKLNIPGSRPARSPCRAPLCICVKAHTGLQYMPANSCSHTKSRGWKHL